MAPSMFGDFAATPIFEPKGIQGFASAQSPYNLPQGLNAKHQNVRLSDGLISARWGGQMVAESIGAGDFRGFYAGELDGTEYLFVGLASEGKVSVYTSSDFGETWSLITPQTSAYGDTRLADNDSPLGFGVIFANAELESGGLGTPHDCLIIQDGTSEPRVFCVNPANLSHTKGGGAPFISVMKQPPVPSPLGGAYSGCSVTVGPVGSVDFATATLTHSTAAFLPVAYTNPAYYTLNETSAAASGDSVTVTFAVPLDASDSNNLIVGLFSAVSDLPTSFESNPVDYKLVISDGVNTAVIWANDGTGPTSSFYIDNGTYLTASPSQLELFYIVCPLTGLAGNPINLAAIEFLVIYLINPHDAASGGSTGPVLGTICADGQIQNGSGIAVSLYSADNRTVGPTFIPLASSYLQNWDFTGIALNDERLSAVYTVSLTGGPSAETSFQGWDYVCLYIELPGQTEYYFAVQDFAAATYSAPDWAYTATVTCRMQATNQNLTLPEPQGSCVCCPPGTYALGVQGRLFVLAGNTFWISRYNLPLRFYASQTTDPVSGSLDNLSGNQSTFAGETLQVMIALGASGGPSNELGTPVTGIATFYLLTSNNLYQLGGSTASALTQAYPVSPHGTLSPWSLALNENRFYWLDELAQVRVCQWGMTRQISMEVVDDQTLAIPYARLKWVWGCCDLSRYFMPYSSAGSGFNDNILVWSELRQSWESIDVPGGYSCESLASIYNSEADVIQMLAFDAVNGYFMNHNAVGVAQDLATGGVQFNVQTKHLHAGLIKQVAVGPAAILAQQAPGFSLSTVRTMLNLPQPWIDPPTNFDPNPVTGTISLDPLSAGQQLVWTLDQEGIATNPDVAVQFNLQGLVPGDWTVYALFVGEKTFAQGPARA